MRGLLKAAKERLELLRPDEIKEFRHTWAKMHLLSGQSAIGDGEFDFVRQETTKAIAIARDLGDEATVMAALGFYATAASAQQKIDREAFEAAEECVALARKLGSPYYKSMGLNALAGYEMRRGDEVTAQAYLAEAARGGGFMSAMAAYHAGSGPFPLR